MIIILQIPINEIQLLNKIEITKEQKKILNYIFYPYLHLQVLQIRKTKTRKCFVMIKMFASLMWGKLMFKSNYGTLKIISKIHN